MADLLTALKSVRRKVERGEPQEPVPSKPKKAAANKNLSSPEDVIETLRSEPDFDTLWACLMVVRSTVINIHAPGPRQAQIISSLLNTTVPDFWSAYREKLAPHLAHILQSVAGLNAIIARLRLLSSSTGPAKNDAALNPTIHLENLLDLTGHVFKGDLVLFMTWELLHAAVSEKVKRDMSWTEAVNLLGSGKVAATLAQAEDVVTQKNSINYHEVSALANGGQYAQWLGRNIANLACLDSKTSPAQDRASAAAQVLAKALRIGYPNQLLSGFFQQSTLQFELPGTDRDTFSSTLKYLPAPAKRLFVEHALRWLSTLLSETDEILPDLQKQAKDVNALASAISLITCGDEILRENFLEFIQNPVLLGLLSLPVRRACLAALSASPTGSDDIQSLLERLMSSFNDPLIIAHAPVLQQEALAQTLLLAAGYLHRQTPMALLMTARSSNHMQGVSNRLDTSNARARWLGMVVGTAISGLVDKEGMKMSFGTDDMETEEAEWYMSLVRVHDQVGRIEDFRHFLTQNKQPKKDRKRYVQSSVIEEMPKINGKQSFGPPRPPIQTEVIGERVTEILDNDADEEDDEFKPYAKPDSDPEDSDEDATLVNRKKARPPVYIRDLMSMLRDDQNFDRFQLGIKHAAALIRRKMNFGSEVKDHAEEIGVILCNLHNAFDIEDFENLRLQAMIAILLSDAKTIAPWFIKQAFTGDYSIAQRCAILSALGLSGREQAGLQNSDEELNPPPPNTSFPSKRLPSHLHAIYSPPITDTSAKRLEAASQDVEQALIKPLALAAADQSTAHLNAVKVRTFSSRMDVERTKRKPAPNALAKIFGEAFFYPLVNRYQQEIAAYGSASVYTSVPIVLVTYLKTIALLFHAAGPATLGLSNMSGEFWDLLLSLRVQAVQDISVLQAVLFSLLTILELNTDKRRVVDEHPKRLMETQQWVDLVFERMGGNEQLLSEDKSNMETKVRTLAAGVLVKAREIIEAYQKELVGYSL